MTARKTGGLSGLLALVGCGSPTEQVPCASEILSTIAPIDGATNVWIRTQIDAQILPVDADATIVVTDASGAVVPGTLSRSGAHITWTASAPLTAGAAYNWHVGGWECEAEKTSDFSFTTGSLGTAPVDITTVTDKVYRWPLAEATFARPNGMGEVLSDNLERDLLIQVTGSDAPTFNVIGAVSTTRDETGVQDMCSAHIPFLESANYSGNPYYELSADELPIDVSGSVVTITDMTMTGAFDESLNAIVGVTLAGIIDTRPLSGVVGEGTGNPGEACELFGNTYGMECIECVAPMEPGPYCLDLYAFGYTLTATEAPDLVERTSEEIAADPACATTP